MGFSNPNEATPPPDDLIKQDRQDEEDYDSNDANGKAFEEGDYVGRMECFVFEGEAFGKLLQRIQWQTITPRYHSLRRTLMTLPRQNVEINTSSARSWFDELRCYIEDCSSAEWDWWPLPQPWQHCNTNQAMLTWTCVSLVLAS